ncbi:MAG: precorrin-3B C(17)-methyltransferase [Pseudomonadota bacterium]
MTGRTAESGMLTLVGVGPGDPDLMTVAAIKAIAAADLVAYPVSGSGSLAARIASGYLAGKECFGFNVPMTGRGDADAAYDDAATAMRVHLARGRNVALLCEGDPMLYGSAASLMDRLCTDAPVEIVPGVSALTACAARAGISLGRADTPITILPATAPRAVLRRALGAPQTLAIYKLGRQFDAVAGLVRAAGRGDVAIVVERATTADEIVMPLAEAPAGKRPYFSTLLVPHREMPAGARGGPVAIVALAAHDRPLAERIRSALAGAGHHAELHGLAAHFGTEIEHPFGDAMAHIEGLFRAGRPIVGVCAAGILIRAVAPAVSNKFEEAPVLAVSADGAAVAPLLGAHRGGTALAQTIGDALGVPPTLTTASDVFAGTALDDPPAGWQVASREPFKPFAAAVSRGEGVADPKPVFLAHLAEGSLRVEETIAAGPHTGPTYIPARVVIGMGAERGAPASAAIALARTVLADANIDPRAVAAVTSVDAKADEAALIATAEALGVPFRVFSPERLCEEALRLSAPSVLVAKAVGTPSVAEASALAAVGAEGQLLVPKIIQERLTVAVAEASSPLDPTMVGRSRGALAVVGIGPGKAAWRTPECLAALANADAFVGYTLYLDLVEDLRAGQSRHDFALGDERARVAFALDLAATGKTVALISSGDPGIYAMAALAAELLADPETSANARRVALTVVPGITAAQAAAARAGAPLGHDFCFVSLSDLLTPWTAIRARLEAAATGDFVTALYNPRSQRRTTQLAEAARIFAMHRPADTPVIIAASLGRPAEALTHTTLGAFDPSDVDMLATVIIGASTTRTFTRGDGSQITFTPRGYFPAEAAQ